GIGSWQMADGSWQIADGSWQSPCHLVTLSPCHPVTLSPKGATLGRTLGRPVPIYDRREPDKLVEFAATAFDADLWIVEHYAETRGCKRQANEKLMLK
ncbi:MAG: hypothetical protein D6694_15845, partial [Gammaproteobacteria bacterium]